MIRRLFVFGLAAFASACAADSPTSPDFRSTRAPEHGGKRVWNTYVLSVEWSTDNPDVCCALGFDTLQFDASGRVVMGGYVQPIDLRAANRQMFGPFPFEKGATVSGQLEGYRGGTWMYPQGREPFTGPCSTAEEEAWNTEFGWNWFDCEYADLIARQTFTGTVRPNGTVVGAVQGTFGLHDVRFLSGTFTLTPIRGQAIEPPAVSYTLVTERSEFVYVNYYGSPNPPYNIQMLVIAKGSDGTTIWTDAQYLEFEAPEGCVREGARIQCATDATFPMTIPVTILPGAEWYIAGINEPVVADFTGQQVVVTLWTNPPE